MGGRAALEPHGATAGSTFEHNGSYRRTDPSSRGFGGTDDAAFSVQYQQSAPDGHWHYEERCFVGSSVGQGATPRYSMREEQTKCAVIARHDRSSSEGAVKVAGMAKRCPSGNTVPSKRPNRPFAAFVEAKFETRRSQRGHGGGFSGNSEANEHLRKQPMQQSRKRESMGRSLSVGKARCSSEVGSTSYGFCGSADVTHKVDPSVCEHEIPDEISSLVEELELVKSRAEASGHRPPRAVEAAASALEPLLRLRDVTGACDLTSMPWLPQLLAVFRNVLRTAVDGGVAISTPRSTRVGAMDKYEIADGVAPLHMAIEYKHLRERVRQQEATIQEMRQRERQMAKEFEDVCRERDDLQNRVWDLEPLSATTVPSGSSSTPRSSCASNVTDMDQQRLARRVQDLERVNSVFLLERKAAEAQISDLVTLARGVLEEDHCRNPHAEGEARASLPKTSSTSPRVRKVSRPGSRSRQRFGNSAAESKSGKCCDFGGMEFY